MQKKKYPTPKVKIYCILNPIKEVEKYDPYGEHQSELTQSWHRY